MQAVDFPSRQVPIIVPSVPGGGLDVPARLIASKLPEKCGRQALRRNDIPRGLDVN